MAIITVVVEITVRVLGDPINPRIVLRIMSLLDHDLDLDLVHVHDPSRDYNLRG